MSELHLATSCPGLIIRLGEEDVTADIVLTEGRANPFGWSQYCIVHRRREGMIEIDDRIGWLESGHPEDLVHGYSFEDNRP